MRYAALLLLALCALACGDDTSGTAGAGDGFTLRVSGAAPGKVVLVGQ